MALGCAPYNATHTDFKSGPVSNGRIWYIVRFAGGVHITHSSLQRSEYNSLDEQLCDLKLRY